MRPLALVVLLSFVVSACGGTATPSSTLTPATAPPTGAATAPSAPTGAPGAPAAARPVFLTTTLTDVRSGAPFTIGGFPGKVVLVIAMAVW
jgi:hypothetical protein